MKKVELTVKEICLINRVLEGVDRACISPYEAFFMDEIDEYKKYAKLAKKINKIAKKEEE